jgi:hypothetical protein
LLAGFQSEFVGVNGINQVMGFTQNGHTSFGGDAVHALNSNTAIVDGQQFLPGFVALTGPS